MNFKYKKTQILDLTKNKKNSREKTLSLENQVYNLNYENDKFKKIIQVLTRIKSALIG